MIDEAKGSPARGDSPARTLPGSANERPGGMDTLLVITVFNEAHSLPELLSRLKEKGRYLEGVDLLFVDDGSSDDTGNILICQGYRVLRHDINLGQGAACNTAMLAAIQRGYGYVITMDGDGQHDPVDIPQFVLSIKHSQADVVVGSRVLGSNHQNAPFLRRLFLPHVTWVVNCLSGYDLTDVMCGFRAYRVSTLRRIVGQLGCMLEGEYTAAELFMRFGRARLEIREIPVHLQDRLRGKSHKGMVRYGVGILRAILRTLLDRNYWRR
jgi:glycosyltransferase involved in cell wall biosynthesis